jgi:hypothetical protein
VSAPFEVSGGERDRPVAAFLGENHLPYPMAAAAGVKDVDAAVRGRGLEAGVGDCQIGASAAVEIPNSVRKAGKEYSHALRSEL